jgi:uncharacterized RDD family membrane protein YckC
MQITCPSCNYSRQIDPELLPPDTTRATCPKCGESFALQVAEQSLAVRPEPAADADFAQPAAKLPRQMDIAALPKAGFWMRVVATLLDAAIVFILQFLLGTLLAMSGFAIVGGTDQQFGAVAILVQLFSFALSFAYYIIFTGHCGQTPGKMALRIKVIRTDGGEIGYGKAAFREVVAKFISGIILGIGYLMVAFDEQKQGLHDRMADTYVIKL